MGSLCTQVLIQAAEDFGFPVDKKDEKEQLMAKSDDDAIDAELGSLIKCVTPLHLDESPRLTLERPLSLSLRLLVSGMARSGRVLVCVCGSFGQGIVAR